MDNVERVKNKLDIVELVNSYVPLKRAGKNYKALCPFHDEKTPSFMVSPELQRYRCFGCGKSGDIFNFVMELEGIDFSEALRLLADKAGVKLKFESSKRYQEEKSRKQKIIEMNELASKFYSHLLTKHKYGQKALQYLKKRGIKSDTISTFKLGYAPRSWDSLGKFLTSKGYTNEEIVMAGLGKYRSDKKSVFDMFRARLIFPLYDHMGRIIGFSGRALDENDSPKYINTSETPLFKKESFLYGLNLTKANIKQQNLATVVEGEFDMISPYQAGIKNIVASKGTALTVNQAKLLKRYTDNVVLIFDSDEAGVEAAIRAVSVIQNAGLNIKIVALPKKFKDPDEVAKANPQLLKELIRDAIPLWDYYFLYASQKYNLDQVYQKKAASNFLLGKISEMQDKVIRSDYIKKFATVFDVSEDVVVEQLSKFEGGYKDVLSKARNVDSSDVVAKSGVFDDFPAVEVYLLALLTRTPREKLGIYIKSIKNEYFSNDSLRKLFENFKKIIKNNKNIDIKAFYDKLQGDQYGSHSLFESIYLLDLQDWLFEPDTLDAEITSVIYRLKKSFLSKTLKGLTKEIEKAEATSDSSKLKKLQQKVKKISQEITAIEK